MMIRINEETFPIIGCVTDNMLNAGIWQMLDDSGYADQGMTSIAESFPFFEHAVLDICFLSSEVHRALTRTEGFISAKEFLKGTPEHTGLLLLPENILPDFSNVPAYVEANSHDYPINAILYSWLSMDNHDRIRGTFVQDEPWKNTVDRELLILPVCDGRITQATNQYEMISNDEIFGWECSESEGRAWYGKIHDYVMSYLLLRRLPIATADGIIHSMNELTPMRYNLESVGGCGSNRVKVMDLFNGE